MRARYPGGREFDRPAARGSRGRRKTMLTTADFIEEDEALVAVATTAGRRRTGRSHCGTTPSTVIRAAAARAGGGARCRERPWGGDGWRLDSGLIGSIIIGKASSL